MTIQAITYQSGARRGQLRTVLVEGAHKSIVVLPAGRLEIMTGQLVHGQTCRKESFWDDVLGQAHDDDTFICPADSVRAVTEVGPVKIKKGCDK